MNLGDRRFRLEGLIGDGGTARVFRAVERDTGQVVAIKVLRDAYIGSNEVMARFQLETELLSRFEHPNIVSVVARGETEARQPWFAAKYAAHGSLADRMLRARLHPAALLGYVSEILDALHYLHQQGVVHRDVKPENVLIDEHDVAMLCDFGIALAPTRRSTLLGDRMGTPSFMPPEQLDDPASVTPRADLFGVGVTLFVALTGQTGMLLLVDHLRPQALAPVPEPIRSVIDRATRPRPTERYMSAWEMALDVADALEAL